jgi:hypothetical protein
MNQIRAKMSLNDYSAMHKRVVRKYLRLNICEACGFKGFTHLSNKSGRYIEDYLWDWQELCPQCHLDYDELFLNRTTRKYKKRGLKELVELIT